MTKAAWKAVRARVFNMMTNMCAILLGIVHARAICWGTARVRCLGKTTSSSSRLTSVYSCTGLGRAQRNFFLKIIFVGSKASRFVALLQ